MFKFLHRKSIKAKRRGLICSIQNAIYEIVDDYLFRMNDDISNIVTPKYAMKMKHDLFIRIMELIEVKYL